jgi:MoxR-like ATPase
MVLATQNPIEQEGTYSLPEAQLDRFMFKVEVGYPGRAEELAILELKKRPAPELFTVLKKEDLAAMRQLAASVHLDAKIEEYIVDLVRATRHPAEYKLDLKDAIRWGAGPRAVVFFLQASQARAIWKGRDFVMPEDVRALAPWILRHRVLLSYEALAEGLDADKVIAKLLEGVKAP